MSAEATPDGWATSGPAAGGTRLAGRRILVVGAGTRTHGIPDAPIGNGRAVAVAAAREGATVVCADIGFPRAPAGERTASKDA